MRAPTLAPPKFSMVEPLVLSFQKPERGVYKGQRARQCKILYKGLHIYRQSMCAIEVIRALVLVVLKSYITIFSTTKYQNVATLVELKPYFLALQLQCRATFGCALQLICKKKMLCSHCFLIKENIFSLYFLFLHFSSLLYFSSLCLVCTLHFSSLCIVLFFVSPLCFANHLGDPSCRPTDPSPQTNLTQTPSPQAPSPIYYPSPIAAEFVFVLGLCLCAEFVLGLS